MKTTRKPDCRQQQISVVCNRAFFVSSTIYVKRFRNAPHNQRFHATFLFHYLASLAVVVDNDSEALCGSVALHTGDGVIGCGSRGCALHNTDA